MCTVSWVAQPDGYELFSNRDEKRTRKPALPPAVRLQEGVRFAAPEDGDWGGTWIGVNEYGVTLCLLNGAAARQARMSRGWLVRSLIAAPSVNHVLDRALAARLEPYAPFTLVAIEPGRVASLLEWDGVRPVVIEPAEAFLPLTSSSFDPDGVRLRRREQFPGAASLAAFHTSHGPRPDAYSVCMHRPDAETVSLSRIRVNHGCAEFLYQPGAPCAGLEPVAVRLPLA